MEQLKVLSNNLRVKILNLFDDWLPRTNKQIADALQLPPSKVHYHVRELERVGLLRLVETRERGGVVEKFYLPIAMNIKIEWNDVQEHPEAKQLKKQVKDAAMDDFWESYRRAYERGELAESVGFAHLTEEEHREMRAELRELFQRWQSRGHKREGTESYRMFWTMFHNENNETNGD
jgi:DNA-binding Lrp family transcriptional regulator